MPIATIAWSRQLGGQQLEQGRRRCRQRQPKAAAVRRVVATSEHWYEEEEEFDALTDAMSCKLVVLVAAPAPAGGDAAGPSSAVADDLRAFLQPLKFDQAFAGKEVLPFAQQVWAGRDKAPYFLKVRGRDQLDAAAADQPDAAAGAAAAFWEEVLQQNWRVELDAGLGVDAPKGENLLVVATAAAVAQVLQAAGSSSDDGSANAAEGAVWALQVDGTQAGDPLDWRLMGKRLALAAVQPGQGSDTILAALAAGSAAPAAAQ